MLQFPSFVSFEFSTVHWVYIQIGIFAVRLNCATTPFEDNFKPQQRQNENISATVTDFREVFSSFQPCLVFDEALRPLDAVS